MTPIQASKKAIEKEVYSNLQDRKVGQKPECEFNRLVRTADDTNKVFPKGGSTNWLFILYTTA